MGRAPSGAGPHGPALREGRAVRRTVIFLFCSWAVRDRAQGHLRAALLGARGRPPPQAGDGADVAALALESGETRGPEKERDVFSSSVLALMDLS